MGELRDKASRYADAFDGASPLADVEGRTRKAAKIRAVLEAENAFSRPGVRILDIGCSFGLILKVITPADGIGVGVDIDKDLGCRADNLSFTRADAEELPFRPASFDIVICNHVYEHTDNADRLLAEIRRVLADDGVCYFAGPNKFEPVEPHYGLPFLSWLPRRLADLYMRATGKGDSYPEKPYSRGALRRLLSDFNVTDYTREIVTDPVRFESTDILPPGSMKRRIAIAMHTLAPFFFPGFVYILRKPAA